MENHRNGFYHCINYRGILRPNRQYRGGLEAQMSDKAWNTRLRWFGIGLLVGIAITFVITVLFDLLPK
jgi:hypothetical protein